MVVVVVVVGVVEVVVVVHSLSHNIALGPSHTFRSRVLVCLHVCSHCNAQVNSNL